MSNLNYKEYKAMIEFIIRLHERKYKVEDIIEAVVGKW